MNRALPQFISDRVSLNRIRVLKESQRRSLFRLRVSLSGKQIARVKRREPPLCSFCSRYFLFPFY
jgi:hypothetical protein